ncbi:hypothetical protein D9M71_183970 [compost metagenome]
MDDYRLGVARAAHGCRFAQGRLAQQAVARALADVTWCTALAAGVVLPSAARLAGIAARGCRGRACASCGGRLAGAGASTRSGACRTAAAALVLTLVGADVLDAVAEVVVLVVEEGFRVAVGTGRQRQLTGGQLDGRRLGAAALAAALLLTLAATTIA